MFLGRRGGGRARPPGRWLAPGARTAKPPPPPFGRQEASPGDQGPPPTPPPPSHTGPRAGGPPPPPPPPPPHPPQLGSHTRGPPPPQGRGGAPTLRRNGDAVRATAAGPAPANPHRRAGATRTTEHEGGRAPHDPPVTTAHSEVTEGGFAGQLGPPGERSTGRPSRPPTPGRHPGRRKGARQRHGEGQKGVPQAAARNESRGAAVRHPPPPRPPTNPPAAGAPAPTPRGRRDGPPPPERGAGV